MRKTNRKNLVIIFSLQALLIIGVIGLFLQIKGMDRAYVQRRQELKKEMIAKIYLDERTGYLQKTGPEFEKVANELANQLSAVDKPLTGGFFKEKIAKELNKKYFEENQELSEVLLTAMRQEEVQLFINQAFYGGPVISGRQVQANLKVKEPIDGRRLADISLMLKQVPASHWQAQVTKLVKQLEEIKN